MLLKMQYSLRIQFLTQTTDERDVLPRRMATPPLKQRERGL